MNPQPSPPKEYEWMQPGAPARIRGQYGQLVPCTIRSLPQYDARVDGWNVWVKEDDNPDWPPQLGACYLAQRAQEAA